MLVNTSTTHAQRMPGVIEWLHTIKKHIGSKNIGICAIGMEADKTASKRLVNSIYDFLRINDFVLTDLEEGHWTPRIDQAVEKTKSVINNPYHRFLSDIADIRNMEKTKSAFIDREKEAVYFAMDQPFRNWLSHISANDDKDEKIIEWYKELEEIVNQKATNLLENATSRDLKGIVKEGSNKESVFNIVIAYNTFISSMKKLLNS